MKKRFISILVLLTAGLLLLAGCDSSSSSDEPIIEKANEPIGSAAVLLDNSKGEAEAEMKTADDSAEGITFEDIGTLDIKVTVDGLKYDWFKKDPRPVAGYWAGILIIPPAEGGGDRP